MRRTFWWLLIFALGIANAIWLRPAYAQSGCGPRERAIVFLPAQYGEHVIAWGIDETGRVLEFWRSVGGSWTVLATVGATSCIVASGAKSEQGGGMGA